MKDVNSLEDFDRWARTVIKGGSLANGPARTGVLIRELEGVMSHVFYQDLKHQLEQLWVHLPQLC